MIEILLVLGLPLGGAALLALLGHRPVAPNVNVAVSFCTFLAAAALTARVVTDGPMLVLDRNRSYVLELVNETAWHHPMHLHGHIFRVISRNRQPTQHKEWQDTVLLAPRERAEIAFVADNPGNWMFHCHILEHQVGGMMGVIRVT